MIEYLFAIWAFCWCVVQLPYPYPTPATGYPMFKTIVLLVAMILIVFAVVWGMVLGHGPYMRLN